MTRHHTVQDGAPEKYGIYEYYSDSQTAINSSILRRNTATGHVQEVISDALVERDAPAAADVLGCEPGESPATRWVFSM
jgi:hypothetical protein